MEEKKKVIIIGSGLGGLTTGVVLAKNGYHVSVLEQGAQIGGCLQCFRRKGGKFETGMHFVGSAAEGQTLHLLMKYLEIDREVELSPLDSEGYDVVALDGKKYRFANGKEAFIRQMTEYFPQQHDNLVEYYRLVEKVAGASSLHSLKHADTDAAVNTEFQLRSVNEVIDAVITDPLLAKVLVGNLPLYAAERDKTPFATHAFILDFYNQSAFRFKGGSDTVAAALAHTIERYGGEVLAGHKVTRILCDDTRAVGVEVNGRETMACDYVVSDAHPMRTLELLDTKLIRPAFRRRINQIPQTVGGFAVYLRFRENAVPYQNYNYYAYEGDTPWDCEKYTDASWPKGFLYMHFCPAHETGFASTGVILSYMQMKDVERWKGTRVGRRGQDYEDFKRRKAEKLLDALEKHFPGAREGIEEYYTSTPLTYLDYTGTEGGSMYGSAKDIHMGAAYRVAQRTKVPNVYLTGQNINSHGMLGVLVGTIVTCSEFLPAETIYRQIKEANEQKETEMKTVVIIGGGLGGLFTGAILAKEGLRVTVLEKNATIGGGLQTFRRFGLEFDTGMHVIGGMQPGGNIRRICQYLGISDLVEIMDVDDDCMDRLYFAEDKTTYRIRKGKEGFVDSLAAYFPEERENLRRYVEALYAVCDKIDLFNLRPSDNHLRMVDEDFILPADGFVARYVKDPKLRSVVAYMNPLYGGRRDETPAFIHAIVSTLYINGASRFAGGSGKFARLLASVIEKAGGEVVAGDGVEWVEVNNRHVDFVRTRSGKEYTADHYVSAIHPCSLLRLMPEKAFPKAYRNRLESIPNSYSVFSLFIKLRPGTFPYINHSEYYMEKYSEIWNFGDSHEDWPLGFLFMTPPGDHQGKFADRVLINALMLYEEAARWEHTTVGHRGADYEAWKELKAQQVLAKVEEMHPGFGACVERVNTASPLTIRDFYAVKGGALSGFSKDYKNMALSQLPVVTKVDNLLLTGQNNNLHGFCGVPLTAINTAEAILGSNHVLNQLNQRN